jgi:hypothetical protein
LAGEPVRIPVDELTEAAFAPTELILNEQTSQLPAIVHSSLAPDGSVGTPETWVASLPTTVVDALPTTARVR